MSLTQATACTAIVSLAMAHSASAQKLTLARGGTSKYRIVIAEGASETLTLAAAELQQFLREVSGAELPVTDDSGRLAPGEIILGDNRHLAKLKTELDLGTLGTQGYTIRTVGRRLVIAGASDEGTLNGVYGFLEDHLGCRWLAADASVVPKQDPLVLGEVDDTQVPALAFREVYQAEAMDPDYARRNRLNGNASIIEGNRMVGERHRGWDMWCHSFWTVCPPAKYLESHPEYFSLVDGKRQAKQLCLTNPDVLEIVTESVKQRLEANPEAQYVSVSQMDWTGACQCGNCRAIDEREGTPMGSVLEFINTLAERFPDKTMSTLSYAYTRRPPKILKPADNVLIMLCSIECNRSRPLATDPASESFRSDVEDWSEICDNVFIWDYVVQFSNLISPFPNLRVLQPNVQFFVDHGAKGMFAQGSREVSDEFAELRSYVLAKLLWDPDCDVERAMDGFLQGYYGPAAAPIREYIDLMHDGLEASGADLSIFGGPAHAIESYLTEDLLSRYASLFDEAERLVAEEETLLTRVERARMPLMFAQLELRHGTVTERRALLDRFIRLCEKNQVRRLTEWGRPPAEYREQMTGVLNKEQAQ